MFQRNSAVDNFLIINMNVNTIIVYSAHNQFIISSTVKNITCHVTVSHYNVIIIILENRNDIYGEFKSLSQNFSMNNCEMLIKFRPIKRTISNHNMIIENITGTTLHAVYR